MNSIYLVLLLALPLNSESALALANQQGEEASIIIRLETIKGPVKGNLDTLEYKHEEEKVFLNGKPIRLNEVVLIQVGTESVVPGSATLVLRSGEELAVTPLDGNETEIFFESSVLGTGKAGNSSMHVQIDKVHAIVFREHFPSPSQYLYFMQSLYPDSRVPIEVSDDPSKPKTSESPKNDLKQENDVILTLDASTIEGILTQVSARGIDFETEALGKIHLLYQKMRAIKLALLEENKNKTEDEGLTVSVTFLDDSYLMGKLLNLDKDSLTLKSHALGKVSSSLDMVRFIEVLGGRSQFLSDLQPSQVIHNVDLFSPRPVQRDANVNGGPIKIREQVFRKGLGMLSHARLEFSLSKKYLRFQAILGMDDSARPQTVEAEKRQGGIAVFKVHVDGKEVFKKEFSYKDPPYPLDIPVDNAMSLGIEVDYGPGFLVLDYANWANAKLIRQ